MTRSIILASGTVQLKRRRRQPDITINKEVLDWAEGRFGHIPTLSSNNYNLYRMFHLEHNYV